MPLRMTASVREAFLAEARVGVVGIDEDGRAPRVIPAWYTYAPEDGVSILVRRASRKRGLLETAMRFSLCVQSDTVPYRHVSVQGPVVEVRDADFERDYVPLARRYLSTEQAERFLEHAHEDPGLIFVMQPEKWITADYSDDSRLADESSAPTT